MFKRTIFALCLLLNLAFGEEQEIIKNKNGHVDKIIFTIEDRGGLKFDKAYAGGFIESYQEKMMENCNSEEIYDTKLNIDMKIILQNKDKIELGRFNINKQTCEKWIEKEGYEILYISDLKYHYNFKSNSCMETPDNVKKFTLDDFHLSQITIEQSTRLNNKGVIKELKIRLDDGTLADMYIMTNLETCKIFADMVNSKK